MDLIENFDFENEIIYIPLDITPKSGSNYCENYNIKFNLRQGDGFLSFPLHMLMERWHAKRDVLCVISALYKI